MPDLVVIVPSRSRPDAAAELAVAFAETCMADTVLNVAFDDDDPQAPEYEKLNGRPKVAISRVANSQSMVEALNTTADALAHYALRGIGQPFAIGFQGDDHRPRTKGWDAAYLDALRDMGTGIVYGNDQLQGERIPTQVAMTADIVRALGYMAPPGLRHLYVDNFWRDLGKAAGCLRYLPDVVVEHLHPVAGKAQWDEGYKRVNAPEVYQRDARAYEAFHRSGGFTSAVEKVRALRSVTA